MDPGAASFVAKPMTGSFLYTFTCRIPFVLGVADGIEHEIVLSLPYANANAVQVFGRQPYVRVRIFNAPVADQKSWPANMPIAIKHFYGGDIGPADAGGALLYEQWVSLETPATFLAGESQADPAYAFHRSLSVLNLFLQAFSLARNDDQVRPISARELRPIVVIGSQSLTGKWEHLGPMLMHPDAKSRSLSSRPITQHLEGLNRAIDSILQHDAFVRTRQWRSRAERRRYEGDAADSIVSFQIAAESLAYELWGLLLVDEGFRTAEVDAARDAEVPYKSLLTHELAQRLGGPWDLTTNRTAVGRYWSGLYLIRNRIIHGGYLPHDGDAEQAEHTFADFDSFLRDRLRANAKKYPRANAALGPVVRA